MNQSLRKLTWVVILTFLIPPAVVSFIGNVAILNTPEFTEKLIRHWSFYAFTVPFMIFTPLLIRSMVKRAIDKINRKEYAAAVSSYTSILITFTLIATSYSFMAFVISTIVGSTDEEIKLSLINAIFYTSVANTPFFLKVLAYLDEIYITVPKNDKRFYNIKSKFRVTTMISSFSGVGLMANSAYALAWRMTDFPEMGITPGDFAQRLMIIGLIIAILQIAPNFILGAIFTDYLGKLKSVIQSMGQKDLTKASAIPSRDEFGLMSDSLESLRINLKSVVERIKENSSYIRHTGEDLASMSVELSSDSAEQAAGAEEIASSIEEMASNINLSADNSEQSAKISLEAKEHMEEGKTSVDQTLRDVLDITEKIKYIDEIANQTNLLAINAYVEAANAGEAGEGFGVIAREVRNLADRSRSAASEIMELSRQTLKNSKISQEKISEIVPQIENMSTYAAEIATSSAEQRSASEQINSAIQTFNESSQRMAASSEELSASSQELQDKSKELDHTVSEFVV